MFPEELTPILFKILQKRTLPNSFFEAIITLKPKTKILQKRKLQVSITDEYRFKNSQQNTSKLNTTMHSKDHTPQRSGIYPRDARIF